MFESRFLVASVVEKKLRRAAQLRLEITKEIKQNGHSDIPSNFKISLLDFLQFLVILGFWFAIDHI